MSNGTITGFVGKTVILGGGTYSTTLTVANGGNIYPGGQGQAAVYERAGITGTKLYNSGSIHGGFGGVAGGSGGATSGGAGILLESSAYISNSGFITGGTGGGGAGVGGYAGGTGISLAAGGTVVNQRAIYGGTGGYGGNGYGGAGGIGVNINGAGELENNNTVYGGDGGQGYNSQTGQETGGMGGDGVYLSGTAVLYNETDGIVRGGTGGAETGTSGGVGVVLTAGTEVINYGEIAGGTASDVPAGNNGGIGAYVRGAATIFNYNVIAGGGAAADGGGLPGGMGGAGVYLVGGGTLENHDTIKGGVGGNTLTNDSAGGNGGLGVAVIEGGTVNNYGRIYGGAGGNAYQDAGTGGVGLLLGGGMVTNTGLITGGQGGTSESGGVGGAGVYLVGGTLINDGTIRGGYGGLNGSNVVGGVMGDAVKFGAAAGTLIVDPGAVFDGAVVGNVGFADVLLLVGSTAGTISGFGTQFTGFRDVIVNNGANWTVDGTTNSFTEATALAVDGRLTLNGDLLDQGGATIGYTGTVVLGKNAEMQVTSLTLNGGEVETGKTGQVFDGPGTAGGKAGFVTVESGSSLVGFGLIVGSVTDSGTIAVSGGKLSVKGVFAGAGAVTIAAGSTLDLFDGAALSQAISGAGTLQLDGTKPYTLAAGAVLAPGVLKIDSGATLTGAGTIESRFSDLGSLSASGGTLTLEGIVSGNGGLAAAAGATLDFAGGGTITGTIGGAGTVVFASALTFDVGAHLSAAHVTDQGDLKLAAGVSITNASGDDFTLHTGSQAALTVSGSGADKFTNMGSLASGGLGTADVTLALVNSGIVSVGSGALAFLGAVTNNGTMSATGAELTIATTMGGTGTVDIGTHGTVSLRAGSVAGQTVNFQSGSSLLALTEPANFGGMLAGFGSGDRIDLVDTAATGLSFAGGVLTVTQTGGAAASLHFAGGYTTADFALKSDAHGGMFITFV